MKQYCDFRKIKDTPLSATEIAADKQALVATLMADISSKKTEIVDRLYEIDDIGAIDGLDDDDVESIEEAEQLYANGCYKGCIAMCGLIAEALCKRIASNNHLSSSMDQNTRINTLCQNGYIDSSTKSLLHTIRLNRNNCIHLNTSFTSATETDRKNMALTSINSLKQVFSKLFSHPTDVLKIIADKVSASKAVTQDQMSQIIRNSMSKVEDHNITVGDISIMTKTIIAQILEIDIHGSNFKEMTITDFAKPFPSVVIDLTYAQADELDNKKIQEGQILLMTIISKVSSRGMTETWHLINIDEVLL